MVAKVIIILIWLVIIIAAIHHLESLSAHADQAGLISWMANIMNIPEQIFLVHGGPTSLDGLRVKIKDTFGWDAYVPKLSEELEISIRQAKSDIYHFNPKHL